MSNRLQYISKLKQVNGDGANDDFHTACLTHLNEKKMEHLSSPSPNFCKAIITCSLKLTSFTLSFSLGNKRTPETRGVGSKSDNDVFDEGVLCRKLKA